MMTIKITKLLLLWFPVQIVPKCCGLSLIDSKFQQTRRDVTFGLLSKACTIVPVISSLTLQSEEANAASSNGNPTNAKFVNNSGLAAKLSRRDPAALKNSVFNIPPSAQIYPEFMRGNWEVSLKFSGYLFPSERISKEAITSNVNIPGFQKCSIAEIADVGREQTVFQWKIDEVTGLEDRSFNMANSINSHLGYGAVESISYDGSSNPNRMTINFDRYKTRNAERIELFFNGRESELVPNPSNNDVSIFVCSEYTRQVTFSLSQEFGVARQVVGNYAHFWTWKQQPNDTNLMTGNILTACYLDPQDSQFFNEPSKPVAIYSHQITAKKI